MNVSVLLSTSAGRRTFLLALCILAGGCTTRKAYRPVKERTVSEHLQATPEFGQHDPETKVPGREHECLEKYSDGNFWLGHVEVTEYGTYQDHHQMGVIERAVEQDTHKSDSLFKNGIAVVVFVHGWFNNAEEENPNLNSFRALLSEVAAEQKKNDRGVLGIYLSWRGESLQGPLKFLSYFGRGRTADIIGQGIMVEALARIRNIHWLVAQSEGGGKADLDIYRNSRLILLGHSFGARALYNAVAGGMETSFMLPYWAARTFPKAQGKGPQAEATMKPVSGVGDLVLLINPAMKSLPYRKVHYAMHTNTTVNYDSKQPVLMMVLSAKNDMPNKSYLPVGETVGNRFRDWFALKKDRTEASQNTTALGHWSPFHTHDLSWDGQVMHLTKVPEYFKPVDHTEDGDPIHPAAPIKTLRSDIMSFRGRQGIERIATEDDPGLLPFMIVSVDPNIIDGHSGFWPTKGNSRAYDFVKTFIGAQNNAVGSVRAKQAEAASARVMPQKY